MKRWFARIITSAVDDHGGHSFDATRHDLSDFLSLSPVWMYSLKLTPRVLSLSLFLGFSLSAYLSRQETIMCLILTNEADSFRNLKIPLQSCSKCLSCLSFRACSLKVGMWYTASTAGWLKVYCMTSSCKQSKHLQRCDTNLRHQCRKNDWVDWLMVYCSFSIRKNSSREDTWKWESWICLLRENRLT